VHDGVSGQQLEDEDLAGFLQTGVREIVDDRKRFEPVVGRAGHPGGQIPAVPGKESGGQVEL